MADTMTDSDHQMASFVEQQQPLAPPPQPPIRSTSETHEAPEAAVDEDYEDEEQQPADEAGATAGFEPEEPPSPLPPLTEEAEAAGPASQPQQPALEDGPPRVEVSAADCQTDSVTVFLDRAEVRRLLRLRSRAGETEVLVRDLTPAIDKDSIRVEVKGPATISDVTYTAVPGEADAADKAAGKAEAAAALERERRGLDVAAGRLERALKQREVLACYADALAKQPLPAECGTPYDPRRVATLGGFFDLYDSQAAKLDDEAASAREQLRQREDAIKQLEQRIKDIDGEFGELLHREIRIYVESRQAADLELQLSYVVARAKWSPRYDLRVHSNESILKIVYYGMVQQTTGEDWHGARVSLSTSQPGVGGAAPAVATQRARFSRCSVGFGKGQQQQQQQGQSSRASQAGKKCKQPPAEAAESAAEANASSNSAHDEAAASEAQRVQSTQLEVPRTTSIPSDGNWHRMTIAVIDLNPTFEHECVPQKSPFAYLKANVINSSTYALLSGPTNIFVDGCFVAKSELKAAAPSEEFQCHLGADHGIRVLYRPVFRKRDGGQSSKLATVSHRQAIELQNSHRKPVKLVVMEPLPLAGEDKMKVNLLEPVIKHPEKYDRQKPVRLNKSNCVEWELELGPGESRELVMRYNIDFPPGEALDYTVVCDA